MKVFILFFAIIIIQQNVSNAQYIYAYAPRPHLVMASNNQQASGELTHSSYLQPLHFTDQDLVAKQTISPNRQQRSLYGGGWNEQGLGFGPIGVGHITKEELTALLDAWKEVEGQMEQTKPPVESTQQPADYSDQQMEDQEEQRPVTVTLPAYVPVQLSAMYLAPDEDIKDNESTDSAQPPAPLPNKEQHVKLLPATVKKEEVRTSSQLASLPGSRTVTTKTLSPNSVKPKSKLMPQRLFKTPPKPSLYRHAMPPFMLDGAGPFSLPPPPPFLARAPGPLELVPSSQILSNFH